MARLALLLFGLSCGLSIAQEGKQEGIGYPTVAAALAALMAKPGTSSRMQDGWTIVQDLGDNAIWSFTPEGHPAHPAAVKRYTIQKDGQLFLQMTALCQAPKAPCDRLIEQFKELNAQATRDVQARVGAKPAAWAPSEEQKSRATQTMRSFLAALDDKRYEDAYNMLTSRMRAMMSFAEFIAIDEDLQRKSGGEPKRSDVRATWYKDPPRAVAPGVYAAFDMRCSYRNISACTETVILHEQQSGEFHVLRHERNVVDRNGR